MDELQPGMSTYLAGLQTLEKNIFEVLR